ncbi:MAG: hypothetical protein LPJ87_05240 [Zoogloeaceae bacterium]|nr:hypothetical protein [Zoogloeaceae bacterium]
MIELRHKNLSPSAFARAAQDGLTWLGPLPTVFFLSLLLSYLALQGKVTPNADGMLYVDAARLLAAEGLDSARRLYDWLFLSALIAGLSSITGMEFQAAAFVLAALKVALVCVVLVAITRDLYPSATWAAVAVVLALPALSNYRDFIVREHGSWLFTLLSMLMLIRWCRQKRMLLVFGSQFSLLVATLFRPESLAFLVVPFLWVMFSRRPELSWRDLCSFLILPGLGAVALLVAVVGFDVQLAGKILEQLQAANLAEQLGTFRTAADRVGSQLSHYVMGSDARRLLFFGLLSLIPIKFLTNLGLFVVPFFYAQGRQNRVEWLGVPGVVPLLWASGVYALILAGLVFEVYFMQARFVALLNLLFVPVLAFGFARLWLISGRWRWLILLLALVSVIDGVYSSSPPKTRFADAADWIVEESGLDKQRVFYGSVEVAYLAGVVHRVHPSFGCGKDGVLPREECWQEFDAYVVAPGSADDQFLIDLERRGFALLREFSDARKRSIYVFERVE